MQKTRAQGGKRIAWSIGVGLCFAVVLVVAGLLTWRQDARGSASFIADLNDDRRLAGVVDNIFVGRVVSQVGTKALNTFPETQFKVEVLENVKGNLAGIVVVNQQGGFLSNELVLMEGDKLLEVGKTYLFATKPLASEGWHTLVPKYGDIPLANEKERTEKITRFKKATEEQIPYKTPGP